MYIRRILNQSEWADRPYSLKTLKSNLQYIYYDYIEAWNIIFLHQTEDFSHSWFINFDSKFKSLFPFWFSSWWENHGPVIEILPPDLKDSVTYFTSKYKFKDEDTFFPNLLILLPNTKSLRFSNGHIMSTGTPGPCPDKLLPNGGINLIQKESLVKFTQNFPQ